MLGGMRANQSTKKKQRRGESTGHENDIKSRKVVSESTHGREERYDGCEMEIESWCRGVIFHQVIRGKQAESFTPSHCQAPEGSINRCATARVPMLFLHGTEACCSLNVANVQDTRIFVGRFFRFVKSQCMIGSPECRNDKLTHQTTLSLSLLGCDC